MGPIVKTPRLAIAAIATAGLLALAACGSSSTTKKAADGSTPGASGAVSASTAAATPVTESSTAPSGAAPSGSAPSGAASSSAAPTTPAAAPSSMLPDGTTTILPGHRVVAWYGIAAAPPDDALGLAGSPENAAKQVMAKAKEYATSGDPVLPAFEYISTLIQSAPGSDGSHAGDADLDTIQKYEDVAVKDHLLLILDIQPGTDHFLPHIKRLQKFLAMPNVSIGLDPEWQFITKPYGDVTGNTTGAEVNTVVDYLSKFVTSHHLPQKLLVIHQFTTDMIENRASIKAADGVAVVQHIDGLGQGGNAGKLGDYKVLHATKPGQFSGFKLFFKEDTDLLSPKAVLALKPAPDLITYQ